MNFQLSTKKSFSFKLKGWQNLVFSFFLLLFLSILFSFVAWVSLIAGSANLAGNFFSLSKPISNISSMMFLRKAPLLESWRESNVVGQELSKAVVAGSEESDLIGWLIGEYDSEFLINHLSLMMEHGENSFFLRKALAVKSINIKEVGELTRLLKIFNQEKKAGKKYLLIFQNSDEIRATGGFMGSYAVLDFTAPEFWRFNIRDIYDPSGLSPSKSSPLGHEKFLGEGKGLLLHDANWSPDLPKSSEDILWFFENIKNDPQKYDGLIVLNFSTLEKAIGWLGDIYLSDEGQFVEVDNLSKLLRDDRSDFFPGSNQKANSLSALQSALWLKTSSLTGEDQALFVQRFLEHEIWKEVQIFSKDYEISEEIAEIGLDGSLYSYDSEILIFPVESNVGINKANNWVSRSIYLEKNDELLRLKTVFTNNANIGDRPKTNQENTEYKTANHLGYVNYHRLITSDNLKLISVKVGQDVLDSWDISTIIGQNGRIYNQFGFLITISESSKKEVVVDFLATDDEVSIDRVILQKQSGIIYRNKIKEFGSDRFLIEEVQ